MRKIIFFLLLILFALSIPAILKYSDNLILDYSRKAAQVLKDKAYSPNFKINKLDFDNANFSPLNSITWQGISSQISLKGKNDFFSDPNLTIDLHSLEIKLSNLFEKKFLLMANGLTILPLNKNGSAKDMNVNTPKNLENGRLKIAFEFDFLNPQTARTQIENIFEEIAEIFRSGKTTVPMNFSGISYFTINKEQVKAMITTSHDRGGYYLVVDKKFFKSIEGLMADKLSDAEATLLSVNVIRLPKLLSIMNDAKRESERYKKVKDIPEDAYRHILWSYLLTMEYGPEFSKSVTDAHEEGDNTNTEADHKMDYNNNTLGRDYAARQYERNEILEHLLRDSRVIREAK